jgi:hypothetical protein
MKTLLPLLALPLLLVACADEGYGLEGADELGEELGARIELSPEESVQFPPTSIAGVGESEIVITSSGDQPLAVHDIYLGGLDAENFEVPDLPLPIMLEPGHEFPVRLFFAPDAEGQYSADLTVVTAGNLEEVEVSRRLIGSGCWDGDEDGVCDDW